MGIVEDIEAETARKRPGFYRDHRNVAYAFEHYLRGRIPLLYLTETVERYGTTGDMVKLSEAAQWTGRRRP